MLFTRAQLSGLFNIGGVPSGNYRNYVPVDPRNVFGNNDELRLLRFSMGRSAREVEEIAGVTRNLDHNVTVELVRVVIGAGGQTSYGTIGAPTDNLAPIDPAGFSSFLNSAFLNGGQIGSTSSSTPDPSAVWRTSFQIRRGFRKRWDWDSAPRMGRDAATGNRETFVMRVALLHSSILSTLFSYGLDLATSPEDGDLAGRG